MQEVTFDTHAAKRKLEGAGCPAPQAEAMVAVVSQATAVTSRMARDLERIKLQVDTNMATRSDLADLRAETREGFASLKAEIEERVENRIESLRTEIKDELVTKGEFYRALWIQGAILATLILSFGAITMGFALYALSGS